ncbi:MAG: metallopeptidase family protein [Alphaproteobacteria bacterium]
MSKRTDWTELASPSLDDIESLARDAFRSLPKGFRALCGELVFVVQDFPDADVVRDMQLESEFDILGLFQGPDLAGRDGAPAQQTMIFLYRRPILDYWTENEDTLGRIVRHVLVHEIGHHFGLSDAEMHAIENGH